MDNNILESVRDNNVYELEHGSKMAFWDKIAEQLQELSLLFRKIDLSFLVTIPYDLHQLEFVIASS
jgi:hypothetical protein